MKIKVNRKELYTHLKSLSTIPVGDNDPFKNKVFLVMDGEYLSITAGNRSNFVTIFQPAEGEGECCVSFDLMKIAKLTKDTDLTLKVEKKMSITGDKGFRGSLSVIEGISAAYQKVKEWRESLPVSYVILNSDELHDLAKMSLEFPAFQESRWVEIMMNEEGEVYGTIQPSELGSIENYPFSEVNGEEFTGIGTLLTLDPENIISQLTFMGSRVKLSLPSELKSPICVSDDGYNFGVTFQKARPGAKAE